MAPYSLEAVLEPAVVRIGPGAKAEPGGVDVLAHAREATCAGTARFTLRAMRLEPREMPGWPPLAWLARCGDDVELWHGPRVEVGPDWAFEGAWDGDFADGASTRSPWSRLGRPHPGRRRGLRLADLDDRPPLPSRYAATGETFVSNSLLALLEAAGAEVTDPEVPGAGDLDRAAGSTGAGARSRPPRGSCS